MVRALEIALWSLGLAAALVVAAARLDGVRFQQVAQRPFLAEVPAPGGAASRTESASRSDPIVAPAAWLAGVAAFEGWAPARRRAFERVAAPAPEEALALLEVPALALRAVVVRGTGVRALNRAVGHIDGTAAPGTRGNVALAAHRDGFFRRLGELAPGDRITLHAAGGRRDYLVRDGVVVPPNAVEVLAPGRGDVLTLVTCHPFHWVGAAPERYVVSAVPAAR